MQWPEVCPSRGPFECPPIADLFYRLPLCVTLQFGSRLHHRQFASGGCLPPSRSPRVFFMVLFWLRQWPPPSAILPFQPHRPPSWPVGPRCWITTHPIKKRGSKAPVSTLYSYIFQIHHHYNKWLFYRLMPLAFPVLSSSRMQLFGSPFPRLLRQN